MMLMDDLSLLEDVTCWPYPVCPLISKVYGQHHCRYFGIIFPGETRVYFGDLYKVLGKKGDLKHNVRKLPYADFDSLKDVTRIYTVDI